jgi:uncharacterized protein YajQ (UPF0234 family)
VKDSNTEITFQLKNGITIVTASEFKLKSVYDLLQSKLVRRNLSLKILKPGEIEQASGGRVRQLIELQKGISQDLARELPKLIRAHFPNAKSPTPPPAVRVTTQSRDSCRLSYAREKDYPVPLHPRTIVNQPDDETRKTVGKRSGALQDARAA